MVASPENLPLLAELLADQQRLATPVATFASADHTALAEAKTSAAARYRDLLPLSAPVAGEQYAFEVDLDACSGCKACVSACHSLNGLDETESWRDVGLLIGRDERHPFQQTVTTACHHCADPACLNGCPVLAYEKDGVTGIVRHLDDQCIGCQYCVLKCPYDVPKYNARLGIVRKCDMCHGRLSAGEPPACAQACPTQAIRVITVKIHPAATAVALEDEPVSLLPGVADSDYTRPTTRYRSVRPLPGDAHPADESALRVQPTHWPLAVMLTLVPLGIAATAVATTLAVSGLAHSSDRVEAAWLAGRQSVVAWIALAAGGAGLLASVAHLGQPLRAWRIFLGWRRSWLSREAMLFGAWYNALAGAVTLRWVSELRDVDALASASAASLLGASVLGLVGLACSAMVYVDTRRRAWRATQSFGRFFSSVGLFAGAVGLISAYSPETWATLLVLSVAAKLVLLAQLAKPATADDDAAMTPELTTARLVDGALRPLFAASIGLPMAVAILAVALATGSVGPSAAWVALGCALLGEAADRLIFFRSVDAPKMPGLPAGPRKGRH